MKTCSMLLLAYGIGSLSPSALIAKIKHKNLKQEGTKNLGATNTILVIGKGFGLLVMLLDIFKGFLAFKFCVWTVPELVWIPFLGGLFAILGHCFPFYMRFKGGKGLATFAGIVLAYRPPLFLFLLLTGCILMVIVNYSFILPFYAASFLIGYVAGTETSPLSLLFAIAASMLIMGMHFQNLQKALRGEDRSIRDFLKNRKNPKKP